MATLSAPTTTGEGRKTTCPSGIWPVAGWPSARCQRSMASMVSESKSSLAVEKSPAASPKADQSGLQLGHVGAVGHACGERTPRGCTAGHEHHG